MTDDNGTAEVRPVTAGHRLWTGRKLAIAAVVLLLATTGIIVGVVDPELGPPEPDNGELVILSGRDDSSGGERQALIEQWNAFHPETPARIVELSPVADQQHNAMIEDAQDSAPGVDIYNLDVTWVAEFAENRYIRPLRGVDLSPFLDGPRRTGLYSTTTDQFWLRGDRVYAVPFNTDAGLLYYRSDLVDRPEGWDDVACVDTRVKPVPAPKACYAGQLADYEGLTVNVLEALRDIAPGQDLFSAGLPKLQAAVDRLRPRIDESPPVVLPDSLTYDERSSTQAMRDGNVLYLRAWPVSLDALKAPVAEKPKQAREFGVAQLPGGGTVLGGQDLAVSARSDQPAAAQQLIEFLTNAPAQRRLFEAGLAPTRTGVYLDSTSVDYEFTQEVLKAVSSAVPRPAGPCYTQFSALLHRSLYSSMRSGKPLDADLLLRLRDTLACKPV